MSRKKAVKVYLSDPQVELLDRVAGVMGEDRSGTLRAAFLTYAKEIGAMEERLLRPQGDRSK